MRHHFQINKSKSAGHGFSLIELLFATLIAGMVIVSVTYVIKQAIDFTNEVSTENPLEQETIFVMERIIRSIARATTLVLPLRENPATTYSESVRNVLAVSMDATQDLDNDGYIDSDNDRDGKVDEDMPTDMNNDDHAGIAGIDDDNDGLIDEGDQKDDDEDGAASSDEDYLDGIDNDNDGSIDEDVPADNNNDLAAGVTGVDDDGDGSIDETNAKDNDEDKDNSGDEGEDWIDTVVYYLNGTQLIERMPDIHAANGEQYTERTLSSNVTQFTVTRPTLDDTSRYEIVQIDLTLTDSSGQSFSYSTQIRLGGEL